MSQSSPATSESPGSSSSARKPRSRTERFIVWGGIAILLLLVAFQAHAKLGYTETREALRQRINDDEGPNAKPLLVKDIDEHVVGWPSRKDIPHSNLDADLELTWFGLMGSETLVVGYDPSEQGGTVMHVESKGYFAPDSKSGRQALPVRATESPSDRSRNSAAPTDEPTTDK